MVRGWPVEEGTECSRCEDREGVLEKERERERERGRERDFNSPLKIFLNSRA